MSTTLFYGSIAPTLNVVHIVGTISNAGVYVFKTDLGAMQNGDEIELRFADKPTSGTIACIYQAGYAHTQATQIKASPPVVVSSLAHVSITLRGGTGRNFPFEVLSI